MWCFCGYRRITDGLWIIKLLLAILYLAAITEGSVCHVEENTTAMCVSKGLQMFPQDLPTTVKIVNLHANALQTMTAMDLQKYPDLQLIKAEYNYMTSIDPDTFSNHSLQLVDISYNRFSEPTTTFLSQSSTITELVLSGNQFRSLPADFITNFTSLTTLRLSGCGLESISPHAFRSLSLDAAGLPLTPHLQTVDLSRNRLRSLPHKLSSQLFTKSLREIRLYDNFWDCDCSNRWVREAVEQTGVYWHFAGTTVVPHCEEPWKLKHVTWLKVPSDQFGCPPKAALQGYIKTLRSDVRVVLPCRITSDAPQRLSADHEPLLTWYINGLPLRTTISFVLDTQKEVTDTGATVVTSKLIIPNFKGSFAGEYSCEVDNGFGKANTTYFLSWIDANTSSSPQSPIVPIIAVIVVIVCISFIGAVVYCLVKRYGQKRTTHSMTRDSTPIMIRDEKTMSLDAIDLELLTDDEEDIMPSDIRIYTEDTPALDEVEAYPVNDAGCEEYNQLLSDNSPPLVASPVHTAHSPVTHGNATHGVSNGGHTGGQTSPLTVSNHASQIGVPIHLPSGPLAHTSPLSLIKEDETES